mmetsp:Transcript_102858/g.296188  ORF Transcript_102858/g.296188 Transcript_102858/m.296188 type:complete len:378 (-) Transcript_102858:755-1888(-)
MKHSGHGKQRGEDAARMDSRPERPLHGANSRPSSADAAGVLDAHLVACEGRCEHHIQREGDVDEADHDANDVTDDLDLLDVALRDAEHRRDLLPADAVMRHEDDGGENVEDGPQRILEDLEFQCINVAHSHRRDAGVVGPEEVQRKNAVEVDEVRRRADVVRAELVRVAEAELEEVNGHEGQEDQARDGQIERPPTLGLHQSQLHVPSALYTDECMQENRQGDVLFDDICGQTKACPVETHIKIAIPVEIIRAFEHMQIADGVDHDEQDQKNGAASEALPVVGHFQVGGREDSRADLVQYRDKQIPCRRHVRCNVDQEHSWVVVRTLMAPIRVAVEMAPSLVIRDQHALVLLDWCLCGPAARGGSRRSPGGADHADD